MNTAKNKFKINASPLEIEKAVQNAYNKHGQSSAMEMANRFNNIVYEHCEPCESEMPTISGKHECLICGHETKEVIAMQPVEQIFFVDGDRDESKLFLRARIKDENYDICSFECSEVENTFETANLIAEAVNNYSQLKDIARELHEALIEMTEMAKKWSVKGLTPTIYKSEKALLKAKNLNL